jgi:hypothetical protein
METDTFQYPLDPSCLPKVKAYDAHENNIEKSDNILCNNTRYYDFYNKKQNDLALCWQLNGCSLPADKNIDFETRLWRGSSDDCRYGVMWTRGGNAKDPSCKKKHTQIDVLAGYDNYTSSSLNDYLLIPCKQNTFRNYISCDDNKCCSIRHQMFMNLTKRI